MSRSRLALAGVVLAVAGARVVAQEVGAAGRTPAVVLGYNDLGMHCMNQDFSELMILPPYNNLHAQVIYRSGEDPRLMTGGITVKYTIPTNTHSADKTNFWRCVQALLGVKPRPNIGLTGNGLSGTMRPSGQNDWVATGIPVTPILDSGRLDPYPLATITVELRGRRIAQTRAVVPVSWEINCSLCHHTPGVSTATNILRAHDRLHGTNLEHSKPVLCGGCHAQAPLGLKGNRNLPSLSRAMHLSHAPRMAMAGLKVSCYACHPGVKTQCLRDVHAKRGMTCTSCHVSMRAVASAKRKPWVDEPRCGNCHHRAGFQFEQPGELFRDSKGHRGVHCEACHGAPHAITPSLVAADNVQAIALQGHAGPIGTCAVCHSSSPDGRFTHSLAGGGD